MLLELALIFPDAEHVQVRLGDQQTDPLPFKPPLDKKTREDLTWYLETYPVHYTTEIDDARAASIAAKLTDWGGALFNAVFSDQRAFAYFAKFRSARGDRLLTVSALHPTVLAQPWELSCDPKRTFLFLEKPAIPIRRRLPSGGIEPYRPKAKDRLHLLIVVSRPDGAGFIDPRADPMALMDAIDAEAAGRVTVEFLRPPTLSKLVQRLADKRLPQVDILHFDGHGAYDPDGRLIERSRQAVGGAAGGLLREGTAQANQGYLVFEDETHKEALVPAELLGQMLNSEQVGLVILSACQSAMVGGVDALGSVAPRLIRAGLPSVLAMTQSVLVATTRALFRYFYRELARGEPIGAALDAARRQLRADPKRGERQRPNGSLDLTLQDWFVPALYQAGGDAPLLKQTKARRRPADVPANNLPPPREHGFFGRRRELHNIERWFVDGTRRIVISGFGGQGKTALATEAGRWLLSTGLFERVCFISYADFQGVDPVQPAVTTLGTVLNVSLIDVAKAADALAERPTLLILDNLESLDSAARAELLAAADLWSRQGESRVLITARPDDLAHPSFPTLGSLQCRYLPLDGLRQEDALDWFQALLKLPPEPTVPIPMREALIALFDQVGFHPLSIEVLTSVLKQQRIGDVSAGLQAQLAKQDDRLVASLNLSLQRLEPALQTALPGLGVFVNGAWEPVLTEVLELDPADWSRLRDGLQGTGLIVLEAISGISAPFIRFHPTLAAAMRARLTPEALEALGRRFRAEYCQWSGALYQMDSQNPEAVRGIALRELPNLLAAAFATVERGEDDAADFANNVIRFLGNFGRTRDRATLQAKAEAIVDTPGSDAWYLTQSNRGEHLYARGQFAAAEAVFVAILSQIGDAPSYRRAIKLLWLARCHEQQGRLDATEARLREALGQLATLPPDNATRRLEGTLHADLGDILINRGDLDGAQAEHERNIEIGKEFGDTNKVAISSGQLGAILTLKRNFPGAIQAYRGGITAFQSLNEPVQVAICHHQLGNAFHAAGAYAEAEAAYREAARMEESLGNLPSAAQTWMSLAITISSQGRSIQDVEPWFLKALAVFEAEGNRPRKSQVLSNLAALLRSDPARLSEARGLAEMALAIKQSLDPGAAEIWKIYQTLGDIAAQQGNADAARQYRAQGSQSFASAPIAKEYLRRHRALIDGVLTAVRQPEARSALAHALEQRADRGRNDLVTAIRAVLDGARDQDTLCEPIGYEDALIISTILRCLADPAAEALLPPAAD